MDDTDNVDQTLDPRIQIELENLNDATDDINKLETELDEAHTAFRQLLSETTRRLKEILNKVGNSSVEKARCYYEALEEAHQAQIRCQEQAQLFQRASEIHMAAKETVALAESRFMSHQHEWNFDQAWQDMLNHATLKVMDAENQKAECGREHYRRAIIFHNAEKRLLELEEKHRRAIMKARSYFEVKAQCDQMLATQKERVECLQKAIQNAKTNYASSLHRLEEISNQIHQQRQDYDFIANGPREPGVGAELVSPQKSISYDMELKQLNNSKIKNPTSNHMKTCDRIEKYDNTCELQDDPEYLGKRSVDGSEATLSQWELELEATMENLKNLTHDNSIVERESREEVVSTLHRCDKGTTKLTNCSQELNLNSPQDNNDVCSQDLNQPKNLTNNHRTFKSAFVKMPLITRFNSNMKKSDRGCILCQAHNQSSINLSRESNMSLSSTHKSLKRTETIRRPQSDYSHSRTHRTQHYQPVNLEKSNSKSRWNQTHSYLIPNVEEKTNSECYSDDFTENSDYEQERSRYNLQEERMKDNMRLKQHLSEHSFLEKEHGVRYVCETKVNGQITTECSRRPIRCPRIDCAINVAFSALTHHFIFDHPEVPILNVDPGIKSTHIVSFNALSSNCSRCLALLLVSGKLSEPAARFFNSNQISPKYRNRLPLSVLAARLQCNDGHISNEMATKKNLQEKNIIIAWVAGLDVGNTREKLLCSIQAVDKIDNEGLRCLTYTGPVNSLRTAQCPQDIFSTGDCIVLHEGLLGHITSDCAMLNINVNKASCVFRVFEVFDIIQCVVV